MAKNVDLELGVKYVIKNFQSLLQIEENGHDFTNRNSPSIYKAPSTLRDLSPTSFDPRVVSIGPIHRDDASVQAFEARKIVYVHKLLHRIDPQNPDQKPLETCVQKVASSIDRIKACYVGIVKSYDNFELTKMMVMDACFILEFINQFSDRSIPGNMLLAQSITYDLMLLENQIPFFVLNDVFQCTMHYLEPNTRLTEFIRPVLKPLNLFQTKLKLTSIRTDNHDHILHVLYKCYRPRDGYRIQSDLSSSTIRSAVELDRAGVNFHPNRDARWPMAMDMKLHRARCCSLSWCKPTFRMPVLRINHFTDLVLRNLIAYEQSSPSLVRHYITSYALAMDMLIDTQEDIAKLVESKVIINHIGSNEEAANMINNICKGVARVDFFYAEQWEELDLHCNGYWPRNIAWLRRTYFSNPWNIIALVAGMVLFALTVVQTYFTIKSARSND